MNKINVAGMSIKQTSEYIEINNEKVMLPDYVKNGKNTMSVIDKKIIINGYVFNQKTMEFQKEKGFIQRILEWWAT